MLFGYMSLGLVLAAFMRSQLAFLQKLLIPSSILAGFLLLLLGPNLLSIIDLPLGGQIDAFVYVLITALFVVMGLRGFSGKMSGRQVAAATAFLTKGLVLQGLIGLIFTLVLAALIKPDLFSAFGSLLMLGYGFDSVIALFFGGFWEQGMGFAGGRGIAFSFSVLGFLFSYILGLVLIIRQRKKNAADIPQSEASSARTGFRASDSEPLPAGKLTTHAAALDTLAFHFAVIGFVLLITFGLVRLVGYLLINSFGPGLVIVGEIFMNLHFLVGFAAGILARNLIKRLKISHVLDQGTLNRVMGVLVDYMIVSAIIAIPLVISAVLIWEVLALALIGGVCMLLLVPLLSRMIFGDNQLPQQAALFGFLTGNITSGIALLRVVDPALENPVAGHLALAGGLVLVSGLPLMFIINMPVIGESILFLIYAILALLLYGALWYLGWRFLINKKKHETEPEATQ